jgi:cation transport ATPase
MVSTDSRPIIQYGWAFFYNSAGIPLAALGFLSPFLCAFAMGFSDLVVIGNALRLMRWRSPNKPS